MLQTEPVRTRRNRIALIGFGAIAAFYLLTEHTAHFFGALPYLLLLACPLMHLFMHHGGHGSGHHHNDQSGGAVKQEGGHPE